MSMPLEGLKVVDFSVYVGGAAASMNIGDFGADVIKVEPPDGDLVRKMNTNEFLGNNSKAFMALNRNKKSIVLDLSKPHGKAIALNLAKDADIVIEDFVPGKIDELGLGYDVVKTMNPKVIYLSMPPFGSRGPYKDLPGYPLFMEALIGGFKTLEEGEPYRGVGWFIGHLSAGALAFVGVNYALYWRMKTGEGQKVETPILGGCYSMAHPFAVRIEKEPFAPVGGAAGAGAMYTYTYYKTKDGMITESTFNERHWERYCKALGLEDLLTEQWDSVPKRMMQTVDLRPILAQIHLDKTTKELTDLFDEVGYPSRECMEWYDIIDHEHVRAEDLIIDIDHPAVGKTSIMGLPMQLSETPGSIRTPAPTLGQHSEEILSSIGYSKSQIDELRKQRITQ